MFCPQNVLHNSPNKMYISQTFSGSGAPDLLLEGYYIHYRNKRMVNNVCPSINKVKL